jgi:cytoskeletal protein RodZ
MTEQEKATLELHGPAGVWGKVSGVTADHVLHFVIIIMLGLLIWQMFMIDKQRMSQFAAVMQSLADNSAQNKQILDNQTKLIAKLDLAEDSTEVTQYILLLSQPQRDAVRAKLTMPKTLAQKIR